MGGLCDLTLDKLGNLSHEVHIEEYSHFDVLTGVRILLILHWTNETLTENVNQISWKRALDIIDMRIGSRPNAESGSLRRWRVVIGTAYNDFQTNFSGYGPTLLTLLALSVDGRTDGSNFPNMMLAAEREPYGL